MNAINPDKSWRVVLWLAGITVFYNIGEGAVSLFFGASDAMCTRTCVYLSIVLLLSSILFEIVKIGYIDSIGAIGIAYYAFMEGRESIEKSKGTITGD